MPELDFNIRRMLSTKTIVVLSIFISVFLFTLFRLRDFDFNQLIANEIIKQVNLNINGKSKITKLNWTFDQKNLKVSVLELIILDLNDREILKTNNLEIIYPLKNLLTFKSTIKSISAKSTTLKASKLSNKQWDVIFVLEKLLSKDTSKQKFELESLNLPKAQILITERLTGDTIEYPNIKIFFKKEKKGSYLFDIDSNSLSSEANHIAIKGRINLNSFEQFLRSTNEASIDINQIDSLSLDFFGSFIPNANLRNLIKKYSNETKLSLYAQMVPIKKNPDYKQELDLDLLIQNIQNYPSLSLITKLKSGRNINIEKVTASLGESEISLNGKVLNWNEDDNSRVKTKLVFHKLNLKDLKSNFNELNPIAPDYVIDILKLINNSELLDGSIEFSNTWTNPSLTAQVQIDSLYTRATGKNNILEFHLISDDQNFILKNFGIPLDFAKLNLSGTFSRKTNDFELKAQGKDLPLLRLKSILIKLPFLKNYQQLMLDSEIKGYAIVDLIFDKSNKSKQTQINGSLKLARCFFRFPQYPLQLNNFNGDFNIKDKILSINSLKGYLEAPNIKTANSKSFAIDLGDLIEAKGEVNLLDWDKSKINIKSPNISTSTLIYSKVLRFLPEGFIVNKLDGSLKNLNLIIEKNNSSMLKEFEASLNNITVETNDIDIANAFGLIKIVDNKINFSNLKFFSNNGGSVFLNGFVDKDFNKSKLFIKTTNLDLKHLGALAATRNKYNLILENGDLSANLLLVDKNLEGSLTVRDFEGLYTGSKYIKYEFSGINGDLQLSKNLQININKGFYGKSVLKNLHLQINKFQDKESAYLSSFELAADLFADEIQKQLPSSIRNLLKIEGYCPANISMTGNNLKKDLKIELITSRLDSLIFANWLKLKQNFDSKIISNLTVTPQLIKSNNTVLHFINPANPAEFAKIKSNFEVNDWQHTGIKYKLDFVTESENEFGTNLKPLAPHIISLIPLNLNPGYGTFVCDVEGDRIDRVAYCNFNIGSAVAQKYGIGDLSANKISVDLNSINNKPLYLIINLGYGDWHGIPFKKAKFDLKAINEFIYINDLRARVLDGIIRGNLTFNINTLESSFSASGLNIPAHELVDGIWGFGAEVPKGLVSGNFIGVTKGIMPDDVFFNLQGKANLIVKEGKLSQLKTMQKVLTAVNTLDNFEINNIFQSLITFKGGLFDYAICSLDYDLGRVSSEKVLLKADQIELAMKGYLDYRQDLLWIEGNGLIPKHSQSILQTVGFGKANLGNLLSNTDSKKEKRAFYLKMLGPVTNPDKAIESVKSSFKWLK